MGGLCPFGSKPPECYAGANGLQTIQSSSSITRFVLFCNNYLGRTLANLPCSLVWLKMVDKLWWDWQNRALMNQVAFGGGSVSTFGIFPDFLEYQTGKAPPLNVSAQRDPRRVNTYNIQSDQKSPPFFFGTSQFSSVIPGMDFGRTLRFGTS